MTINPGTRLGPYEITARIGAGGMGEVWKARDTRLERNVAIKSLPPELAQNAQLRLRFEQEAKTISQLNHPHICTLYDVGEGYLVMELLEGESLADRLARGPLPMPEVLKLGAQIADALDRAHRAGVVHRDVKPGNVMLTKSGAKLLDFGLARNAVVDIADGATMHKPLTQEGMILGTFQYMAPEQLEGVEADARTDMFSLGAVLYEMATGLRAFDGKTKTSLIAAIVKEQPRAMSEVIPLTPRAFEHVVTKCLAKDPEERWQSARDVSQELRWIADSGSQPEIESPLTRRRRTRAWIPWAAALLIASGAVAMTVMRPRASSQVMRFSAPNTISARPNDTYGIIAISPDGSQIIYSASDGASKMLYRRSIDQFEAKAIAGTEDGMQPFFSPDGKWLGFFARQRLWKIALSGGQPIEIGRASAPRGAQWLEDDTIVFCPFYYGGIERIPSSGGKAIAVSTVDRKAGERSHRWPHSLPGGKTILYSIGLGSSWDNATIVAQRLDNGTRKVIVSGGSDARYVSSTGHLVYVRGNSLYAVPFDPDELEVRGTPVEVATGVANHSAGGAEYAFSRNGMLIYFSQGVGGDEGGRLAVVDRRGERIATTLPPFSMVGPKFSPDGKSIAGTRGWDLWTFDTIRGTSTRVTTGVRTNWTVWSGDGSRLYYGSERVGPWEIFSRAADGSDEERQITNSGGAITPQSLSPDGREILARTDRKETGSDIDLVNIDGRVQPLVRSENHESPGSFSPDGRWIVYHGDGSGGSEVYVRPKGGTGRFQISNAGGSHARWVVPDEIIYSVGSKLMSVRVQTSPSFTASAPVLLFERNFANFDVARDGRILLVEAPETSASAGQLNVVVNWFAEIGKEPR